MEYTKKIKITYKSKNACSIPVHVTPRIIIRSRKIFRAFLALQKQVFVFCLAFLVVLFNAHGFMAFEAHVVNVTAEIAQIDPPTILPSGGTYEDPIEVSITDDDFDATHIFYTLALGSDGDAVPDPTCGGGEGEFGGQKPLPPFPVSEDTVVKAIACDSADVSAHGSLIVSAVYTFIEKSPTISGYKYHDLDQDGIFDDGIDFGIEGWRIDLLNLDDSVASTTVTDSLGFYNFRGVPFGSYTVREESRDGWDHITPKDFPVSIENDDDAKTFDFYNFDTGFACVPKDIHFDSRLAVEAAGSSSANDDVGIASNVVINGDVRSNDEIEIIGGGGNRTINGSATTTNSIDAGITVTKMTLTGASTVSLPDAMIAEWKARAADGGTVNGSFTFPNGTVGLGMGPSEIRGNVIFGSSNSVTLRGPLYIQGNLSIGSNSIITQDPAFGDQFIAIVVDGLIDIDSNVSFNGSGSKGAFLLISTHAAVSGDDAAIETSSNNSDLGDVVLYASDGDIHVRSNRTILAAFATHGTGDDSDDNTTVRLDSNVTVNYRTLPDKISCGPRQPFETTSHIVINEFIPNPIGADDAAKPGGEWVELFNPTASSVDVAGWVLYDSNNTNELVISVANTDTGGTLIPSHGFLVVYRNGDGDFALNNSGGDSARLFTDTIGTGGVLVDSHTYTVSAPENKSFARIPDGAANWIDPEPTPGDANTYFLVGLDGGPFIVEGPLVLEEELIVGTVETSDELLSENTNVSTTSTTSIADASEEDAVSPPPVTNGDTKESDTTPDEILEEESENAKVEEPISVEAPEGGEEDPLDDPNSDADSNKSDAAIAETNTTTDSTSPQTQEEAVLSEENVTSTSETPTDSGAEDSGNISTTDISSDTNDTSSTDSAASS